jgi:mono/diheme cytochrome c family protein
MGSNTVRYLGGVELMRRLEILCLVSALVLAMAFAATGVGHAQPAGGGVSMVPPGRVTTGRLEYRRYCAACHGAEGKGDGPVGAALVKKPADLTMLAKNDNGEFPKKRVEAFIDGSETVAAHGTREMPIWGLAFRKPTPSSSHAQRTPQEVNQRINLLVDYIESIQAK